MVYCGKPSRGCQMCRTRRIKCDETKPTCNQCAKSHRQCPGYKDEFDLIFRNETVATERRAKSDETKATVRRAKKAGARGTITTVTQRRGSAGQEPISPVSSEDLSLSPAVSDSFKSALKYAIIPALQIPLDTRASHHFVSNFVLIPRQGSTRGFMDYLGPLLQQEKINSPLQHAFNACALANLGNRVGTAQTVNFQEKAIVEYTRAVREVNMALDHPEARKSDATLAAVLMLGMFENISAKRMGDFAWGNHIEGAIKMVKERGKRQLRTKIGLLLFVSVRTQYIIHTLTSAKAPIMGAEWWMTDVVTDKAASTCQNINLLTAELRAEVTETMATISRTQENVVIIRGLMRKAQALDAECVKWIENIPAHYRYKTLCWEDNVPGGDYAHAEVFPGRVDVYQDFWIASVWNMLRVARIIIHSVLVRCAAWVAAPTDYRTTPEYAASTRVCGEMITDIIASVPYHLGWHSKRRYLFNSDELSGFMCGEEDSMKGLAGYFLTWPLACINGQDYVSDVQRRWVIGRLRYIGDELGIRYAHILSQLQIRMPSMLISRDGLQAQGYGIQPNFVKMMSEERDTPPSSPKVELTPQQLQGIKAAVQSGMIDAKKAEILTKFLQAGGSLAAFMGGGAQPRT